MTGITIALPDDTAHKLNALAERLKVTPEELVRASVEELLASPEEAYANAVDYVLEKNKELYKRLAA
jgi:predicted transcriptional regulator